VIGAVSVSVAVVVMTVVAVAVAVGVMVLVAVAVAPPPWGGGRRTGASGRFSCRKPGQSGGSGNRDGNGIGDSGIYLVFKTVFCLSCASSATPETKTLCTRRTPT
ncbi:unnamed protein product, partial [Laminaria digitata]